MCRSQAEGGQRCSVHARTALAKAAEARRVTLAAWRSAVAVRAELGEDAAPVAVRVAAEDAGRRFHVADRTWRDALTDYASTDEGRTVIQARLDESTALDPSQRHIYMQALDSGQGRREISSLIASGMTAAAAAVLDPKSRTLLAQQIG